MLIAGFPAGPWGTNCYVAATEPGTECVVIDPGKDAAQGVEQVVREHKLKPVAVLVTHGHVDHMWCVAPVAGTYDATAWIHPDDRHLLANPMAGMSAETTAMMLGGKYEFAEPDRVEELSDAQTLELAGLSFVVDHTPGHTEGSVTFRTPYGEADVSELMFSGDLLFAGSIGRTDLPGGDHPTMLRSLRDKVLTLRDDIVVLPGHGEQTSIARERATNPFLLDLIDDDRAATPARSREGCDMSRPTPLSGFPELLPAQRYVEQQVLARLAETFELHGFASVETRAVEPLDQLLREGETSKEVYVLRRIHDEEGDAGGAPGSALRPHRAVRALRAGERRQARVPVPPLPDPEGVARRAAAGGSLPGVHPGRHRRDRARHARLPPRRRGGPGDARRPARARPA